MKYGLKESEYDAIQEIFSHHKEVEEVLIYGSRAKGNYKPASDIDLSLKGNNLTVAVQNKISDELDDLMFGYTCDLSIYQHISNTDLLNHIERVGKVFYKKAEKLPT